MHNADIADIFNQVADLLEIEGESFFRVRAYRNAARTVAELPYALSQMAGAPESLTRLPGIGKDLAAKIVEICQTGALSQLKTLQERTPAELCRLLSIASLGPKRIKALQTALGIRNEGDLIAAARAGKIRHVGGFGPKTEKLILDALEAQVRQGRRFLISVAEQRAAEMVAFLKMVPGIGLVTVAGSLRRRMETIGDLDIVVTCRDPEPVMNHLITHAGIRHVVSKGIARATVVMGSGLQVDVRAVAEESYGAALHYFTGSQSHNVAIRQRAVRRRLKINEYGVYDGDRRIAGRTETEIYAQVGLPYIEPELRENSGELEAAEQGRLPKLIEQSDIRGDLHAHTRATDGKASLEEMAAAARAMGYEYLAITEHSRKLAMARGLDPLRLAQQIDQIDRINRSFDDFVLLKGIEVDILEDGTLDLPDDILRRLDFRICSVHYHQNLPRDKQTDRILRAVNHPLCDILGHPTGRLIDSRRPYDADMQRIMQAARDNGCILELNSSPDRLDLNDHHCRMAKQMGVRVAINTDAHSTAELALMRLGVDQARRGWLQADDVINTRGLDQLHKLFAERSRRVIS
jgi:DNA polymerase (family X)